MPSDILERLSSMAKTNLKLKIYSTLKVYFFKFLRITNQSLAIDFPHE